MVTDDYDDLLADDALDAVVVATSVPTHYPLGKKSLEAGKHTFVEKPHRAQGRRRRRTWLDLAEPRAWPSWSATCSSTTPAVRQGEGADRRRRARQGLLRLRAIA